MAEPIALTPIAPGANSLVNPVDISAPSADEVIAQQRKQRIADYNNAIDHPDPTGKINQLNNVIKSDPLDPVANAAIKAKNVIQNGADKFNAWVSPIDKAGGAGTPAGNLAVAKVWETQKDHPQWGTALIAYLTGNKAAALNYVTGGQEKDNVIWGKDGGRYIATVNELGQTSKVKDASGNELSPQDVQDLGISYDSYEKTQAAENEKLTKSERTKKLNSDVARNNENYAFWKSSDELAATTLNNIKNETANLSSAELQDAYGTLSKAVTDTVNASANKQGITTTGGSTSVKTDKSGKVSTGGKAGPEAANISGNIAGEASTGVTSNTSNTKQDITGNTSSGGKETNISQNRETLKQSLALKKLSPAAQNAFLNAYDTYVGIVQGQANLSGKPSFIATLQPAKLGDQQSQLEAQLLLVRHNAAQMASYKKFFNESLDDYKKTKTIPDFGELDSKFMDTPQHKALTNDYGKAISKAFQSDPTKIPTEQRFPGAMGVGIAPVGSNVAPEPSANSANAVAPVGALPQNAATSNGASVPPAILGVGSNPIVGGNLPAASNNNVAAKPPRINLPKGIPAGSRDTGKFSTSGKKVYRAPDGSLHTED